MDFLVVGYGSIGRRHTGILRGLGHSVTTVDPVVEDADYCQGTEALTNHPWDAVLDCTPPDVREGIVNSFWDTRAWFVEKPLGRAACVLDDSPFRGRQEPVMVGFCYYWLPSLGRFVRDMAHRRICSVSIVGGHFLPLWHEDEDYRNRYHGAPGRGGVVLDSLPHSLFIARWLLGDVEYAGSAAGKFSGLEIETPDTAAVLLRAPTGQPCSILVDYLRLERTSYVEVVTGDGSVMRWDFDPAEADEMYLRQMEGLVKVCAGEMRYGFPGKREGLAVEALLRKVQETVL